MGWQDAPPVDQVDAGTGVSLDQLQSQGLKYTPDQMRAFDQARGQLLAGEANGQGYGTTPPTAEINNLNPIQRASFEANTDQPVKPAWMSAPAVEDKQNKPAWMSAPPVESMLDKGKKLAEETFNNAGDKLIGGYKGALAFGTDLVNPMISWPASGVAGLGAAAAAGLQGKDLQQSLSAGGQTVKDVQEAMSAGSHLSEPYAKETYDKLQSVFGLPTHILKFIAEKGQDLDKYIADKTGFDPTKGIRSQPTKDSAIAQTISDATGEPADAILNFMIWHRAVVSGGNLMTKPSKAAMEELQSSKKYGGGSGESQAPSSILEAVGGKPSPEQPGQAGVTPNPEYEGGVPYSKTDIPTPTEEATGTPYAREEMVPYQRGDSFTTEPGVNSKTPFNYTDGVDFPAPETPTDAAGMQIKGLIERTERSGTPPTALEEPQQGKQGELFTPDNIETIKKQQEDTAWTKYKQRVEEHLKQQAEEDAARNAKYGPNADFQPEQQAPTVEKMQAPISDRAAITRMARAKKQGGAVNFGGSEEIVKRLENLKKGLLNIGRDRESFGVGDTVRLMNGKTGTITDIKEGRYQIRGKDFMDSVPVQGIDYKYKPAGIVNGGVGYPKGKPLSAGPGGKQRGAVIPKVIFNSKDPTLSPEKPRGTDIPLSDDAIIDLVRKNWNRSTTPAEFKDMLRLESKFNRNFPQEIIDNAESIYKNWEDGFRPDRKSVFSSLSNLNQRESADNRPLEQMMQETVVERKKVVDKETGEERIVEKTLANSKLKEADDLSFPTAELYDPRHIISTNWQTLAGKIYNNIYSNLADIHKAWKLRLAEFLDYHKPFMDLARKEQQHVTNAERFWDRNENRQKLVDQGLQWPTDDMLKAENGLTPKEVRAYQSHAAGYTEMHRAAHIEQAMLPGYMPHTWYGAWRVNVIDPATGLIEVGKFSTRYGAKNFIKDVEKRGLQGDLIPPKLGNKNEFARNLENQIISAQNFSKVGKLYAKQLSEAYANALKGTITESLERRGIKGFLGEEGIKPENLANPIQHFKNRHDNNKVMSLYVKAAHDFAREGRNKMITQAVARPFFQNMGRFSEAKILVDSVNDLLSTATGFRAQEAIKLDRWVKSLFIKAGMSPNAPTEMVQMLNTYARLQRINSANVGFAAEHILFGLPGMFDLLRMHYERGVGGEKQGSYMKAAANAAANTITFGKMRSKDSQRAEQWAVDNGVYHSNYYDAPEYNSAGKKAVDFMTHGMLTAFVNRAKSVTFHMAYQYFKDIMPRSEALEAARNHTMKTMQSFDEIDRPEVFKEGIAGTSLRTFNQIHLYNLARAHEMIQAYVKNVKEHPFAGQKLLVPMIGLAALWTALGGAKGITLPIPNDDWDWLRKKIMEDHPTVRLPSYTELMLNSGVPDRIVYGLIPTTTGLDTRGTFSFSVSGLFSGAGLEAGGNLLHLAANELIGFLSGKKDPDATYKDVRKLVPTTLVPWVEDSMADRLGGNTPTASKLEPTSERTPEEDLLFKIFSKRAITESMRNEKVQTKKEQDARNEHAKAAYLDLIIKNIAGFDTGRKDAGELIDEAVNAGIGFDTKGLQKEIAAELLKLQSPEAVEYIKKAARSSDISKATKFREIERLMSNGGQFGK